MRPTGYHDLVDMLTEREQLIEEYESVCSPMSLMNSFRQTALSTATAIKHSRLYASISPHAPLRTGPYEVFDEKAKIRQRDRAILRADPTSGHGVVDYLREEIAERLSERVEVGNASRAKLIIRICGFLQRESWNSLRTLGR